MTDHDTKTSHQIIQSFEANQLKDRTFIYKIADWLTSAFGSITFLLTNGAIFILWILVNDGYIPGIPAFDPFPFILLTMVVSLEAIFLSIIVLMSQNRQGFVSSLREELDMQVDLIAEREVTMSLKVLKKIAEKLDVKISDAEFEEMVKETNIPYIERQLQEQMEEVNKAPKLPVPIPENIKNIHENLISKSKK